MPFEISVPEGSALVTSRPHRINPILAKEVDATLNQFLAASLVQHWTSPYSSPLVAISKKSGGVRITVNYKKLNKISNLSQLPIPRVDQVLDSLGKGRAQRNLTVCIYLVPDITEHNMVNSRTANRTYLKLSMVIVVVLT